MTRKHAWLILVSIPARQMINGARCARWDDSLKWVALAVFALGVAWAEYAFFDRLLKLLSGLPMGIAMALLNAFSMMGSFLFGFLFYSSVITALTSFYRSDDLRFLIHTPVRLEIILLLKWFDTAFRSAITLLGLSIPPMIALMLNLDLGASFMLAFLGAAVSLAAIAVSGAAIAAMLLMAVFPAKRLHQTLSILGLCIAVALIGGMRFLHLETLWSEDALSNPLMLFLQQEPAGWVKYGPGSLFAMSIRPYLGGGEANNGLWSALMFGAGSIALSLAAGRALFMRGWWKCQEQGDPSVTRRRSISETFWERRLHQGPVMAMMGKDWLIAKRDPSIWTQLFMMIPLVGLYLVNLSFLPTGEESLAPIFAAANVGVIALLVSVIGARYVFPSASRDGKAVWTSAASPAGPLRRIVQKILFAAPPVALVSGCLLAGSCAILQLPQPLTGWSLLMGGLLSVQISLLAVFLGFCFPMYDHRHLMEVSLGKGAFLFMTLATLEIAGVLYFTLRPWFDRPEASLPFHSGPIAFWIAGWLVLTAAFGWLSLYRTRRFEWAG